MSGFEYRVRWKREDHRSGVTRIYQTKAAAERCVLVVEGRLAEVFPNVDPEDFACCDGGDMAPFAEGNCNCGGKTHADQWRERNEQFAPLVEGPTLEVRPVGIWSPA